MNVQITCPNCQALKMVSVSKIDGGLIGYMVCQPECKDDEAVLLALATAAMG